MRHVFALVLITVGLVVGPVRPLAADWEPPVDAPVVDEFRPPESRYGSGNRGLEYGAPSGSSITAVDSGRVTFAGLVGRARHVVVDHGDGLRSTYAYLESISVTRGQQVRAGTVVGSGGPGFHLTARLGDVYVDPALLFAGAEVGVRLVDGAPLPATSPQRLVRAGTDDEMAVLGAIADLSPVAVLESAQRSIDAWHHQECTEGTSAVPSPGPGRVLIQVGGLGSSDDAASIGNLDAVALGYDAADVVGFSYNGGCTPSPYGLEAGEGSLSGQLPSSTYDASATEQDVEISAARLADLIDEAARARPGQPIDVVAHSLGGVVTRRALEILEERRALLDVNGVSGGGPMPAVVMTVGSPHGGADLASAAVAMGSENRVADVIGSLMGDQGSFPSSDVVSRLAESGLNRLDPPGPPPSGVTVVAVAGATDPIVVADKAIWDGATNSIIPTDLDEALDAHSALPGQPEVARELALAVAGMAPRCVALAEILRSTVLSEAIGAVEDLTTAVVGIASWLL